MASAQRTRVVADPSIGMADLLLVLETWLNVVGNSHMSSMLKPPQGTTWKTSAVPSWLCKLAPLWKSFLKLAPNGVLPSKKHRQALEKLQDRREVNLNAKVSVEDFAITMDEWITCDFSNATHFYLKRVQLPLRATLSATKLGCCIPICDIGCRVHMSTAVHAKPWHYW